MWKVCSDPRTPVSKALRFRSTPARASVRDAATLTRPRAHTTLRNAIPFDPNTRAARRHAGGRARLHFNNVSLIIIIV